MYRKTITSSLMLALCASIFAQNPETIVLKEDNGVKVLATRTSCTDNPGQPADYYLLKVENNTSDYVELSFHLDISYNGECRTCNDTYGEYTQSYALLPNQSEISTCTDANKSVFIGWVKEESIEELLTGLEISSFDLIRSPYMNESLIDDPKLSELNFKISILGDELKNYSTDSEEYKSRYNLMIQLMDEKVELVKKYAQEAQNPSKHIVSKEEFEQLPQEKKDHILSNPDLYEIK